MGLAGTTMLAERGDVGINGRCLASGEREQSVHDDLVRRQIGRPVAKATLSVGAFNDRAVSIDTANGGCHVGELAEIGAGVHDQAAPYATGHAREKLDTAEAPTARGVEQAAGGTPGLDVHDERRVARVWAFAL